MSSYLYDPHSIRQKPNRYYQRKGQILRAKNLDAINPAISRDQAFKYLNAIKMYFPEEFSHPPCPPPPPCPDPPECPTCTNRMININQINLSITPLPCYITCNLYMLPINLSQSGTDHILVKHKDIEIPDEIRANDAIDYMWLSPRSPMQNRAFPLFQDSNGILYPAIENEKLEISEYNVDTQQWENNNRPIDQNYTLIYFTRIGETFYKQNVSTLFFIFYAESIN